MSQHPRHDNSPPESPRSGSTIDARVLVAQGGLTLPPNGLPPNSPPQAGAAPGGQATQTLPPQSIVGTPAPGTNGSAKTSNGSSHRIVSSPGVGSSIRSAIPSHGVLLDGGLSAGPVTVVNPEQRARAQGTASSSIPAPAPLGPGPESGLCRLLFPTEFAGDVAPEATLSGLVLDHFEIQERIGIGGMGTVFRALDTRLQRMVALKVLSPAQSRDPAAVQRFQNEAQAAARLDHDNIARVYYIGEDRGLHFIAFEFVTGVNIRELIRSTGRFEPEEAVNYALQIASALRHTSAAGVVHRDIKPSNIIVGQHGRAKLVDLGLARKVAPSSEADLTIAGTTLGTFDYISPEQARDPRNVDVRSDIYSLGCTLYHMLTGEPPYPDGTVLQKLLDHQGGDTPDPARKNRRVPPNLSAVVQKMMASDPRRRYASPEELIRDLMLVAGGLGMRGMNPEGLVWAASRTKNARFWEKNLGWMLTASLLLIAVVALDRFPSLSDRLRSEQAQNGSDRPAPSTASGNGRPSQVASGDGPHKTASKAQDDIFDPPLTADLDRGEPRKGPSALGRPSELTTPDQLFPPADLPEGSGLPPVRETPVEPRKEGPAPPRRVGTAASGAAAGAVTTVVEGSTTPRGAPGTITLPEEVFPPIKPPESRITEPRTADTRPTDPKNPDARSTEPKGLDPKIAERTTLIPPGDIIGPLPGTGASKPVESGMPPEKPARSERPMAERPMAEPRAPQIAVLSPTGLEPRSFPTLEAACAEADDGAIIEVRYNGSRNEPEKPLRIANKKVTIRAAKGFRPLIEFAPRDLPSSSAGMRMIAISNGSLELSQVDVRMTIAESLIPRDNTVWSIFSLGGAEQLRLHGVTVTVVNPAQRAAAAFDISSSPGMTMPKMKMTPGGMTVERQKYDVKVTESFVRGACDLFLVRTTGPGQFDLERSAASVEGALMSVHGGSEMPSSGSELRLRVDHVTAIVGSGVLRVDSGDVPRELLPLHVDARNNIFASRTAMPLVSMTGTTNADDFRRLLRWLGEKNFYDRFESYWSITTPQGVTDFDTLDFEGWKRVWSAVPDTADVGASRTGIRWVGRWIDRTPRDTNPADLELDHETPGGAVGGATDGNDAGADLSKLVPADVPAGS